VNKYFFKGKIYPDGLQISFNPTIVLKFNQIDFGIYGEVSIFYNNSDITIEYRTDRKYDSFNLGEIDTLANFIEDVVRVPVDAFCFSKSYAYDVYIVEFRNDLGFIRNFLPRGEYNLNVSDIDAGMLTNLILSKLYSGNNNSSLINILGDFRMSIKHPKMTASFCYRAIETIKQNFFKNDWFTMRNSLHLQQKDFSQILKFGKLNRHGDYPTITYKEREEIMNFTRSVILKTLDQI
jgi:hypothetical protein